MLTFGILASHQGSNTRAVAQACRDGRLDARIGLIISNNKKSGVLAFAREHGVPCQHIGGPRFADDRVRDEAILEALQDRQVQVLLLLGYMKLLGPRTVAAYRGRILNTHPALLPKFGGQGMYGQHVHRAVLEAGETETGISVHLIDEIYDHGAVLAQTPVPVEKTDTVETLTARVQAREHAFLVETLQRIASGEIALEGLAR
ncbi:MAG: phosphoribosylglycinamide formyltransferase [Myxococcales bacterium]|nr:phosphoribosylglycinamide formyltransferase [Myxococcales bacterium]